MFSLNLLRHCVYKRTSNIYIDIDDIQKIQGLYTDFQGELLP